MRRHPRHTARRPAAAIAALCVALAAASSAAHGSPPDDDRPEPRHLVDVPTAGMARGGGTAFQADYRSADGLDAGFVYGITDRLMIGLSYGATRLIGARSPDWNEVPGVLARVRIVEESTGFPALVAGFESQGADGYLDGANRFTVKSPGVYAVVSKNYDASGYLGLHGGLNYSFEKDDGDGGVNLFAGVDKSVGGFMSLVGEYNFGWNDDGANALGRGRGYLNAGATFHPGAGVALSIMFKDFLENQPHEGFATRTLRVTFAR